MIERGIESPHWMAKQIIANADSMYVKYAVVQLMDWLYGDRGGKFTGYEVVDRLVQVASTGTYEPPACTCDHEDSTVVAEFGINPDGSIREDLTPDEQRIVDEFEEYLGGLPDGDDPHDTEDDDDQ